MSRSIAKSDEKRGIILPEMSEELAYFLGILAGDGSIQIRREKHDYCIKCVGNPKDEQEFYVTIIAPLIQKLFGLLVAPKYYDRGTTFGFQFSSKSIVQFLIDLGVPSGQKYDSLHIPLCVKKNTELITAYLRGLFDTDGCVCFKRLYREYPYYPVISFSSRNAKFVAEVVVVLRFYGVSVYAYYDRIFLDLRVRSAFTQISQISINGKKNLYLWMSIIGFSNPKHLKKIQNWEKGAVACHPNSEG